MSNEYIVERNMKYYKLQRKARRGEIAVRRLYKFIRFLFIIFIFYAIYRIGYLHYWYLTSDIYTNPKSNSVKILGNKIISKNKIIEQMKKVPLEKKPIYQINPSDISKQIETLAPIRKAYVRRFWFPARIVVMIDELKPAIVISPSETAPDVLAFAITGEIIPKEYLPLSKDYYTVKVLSYGTKGDDYEKWDKEKIHYLDKLAKHIQTYSGENIEYIDLREPHNVFVQLKSVKIRLGELDESAFERIKPIGNIISEIKSLNENVKYVDMAWETKYLKLNK